MSNTVPRVVIPVALVLLLGVLAFATLRRPAVGPFRIDEATPPDEFTLLGEAEVLARL